MVDSLAFPFKLCNNASEFQLYNSALFVKVDIWITMSVVGPTVVLMVFLWRLL